MFRIGFLALAIPLMACVEAAPLPIEQACGAPDLQYLVGQSATTLQTMRFGVTVRFIRPGDAVTEDFSPSRLNILIDGREVITAVSCG